jgi:hypothetical protein
MAFRHSGTETTSEGVSAGMEIIARTHRFVLAAEFLGEKEARASMQQPHPNAKLRSAMGGAPLSALPPR